MNAGNPAPSDASAPRWGRMLFNLFFASFGYVAIRMLIAPVRIKLLTSLLTKEDYGLLTLIMLTVSFLTLIFSLGSLEYMLRKLPGRPAADQYRTLRTVMSWFGRLAAVVALAGAGLLLVWQPGKVGLVPHQVAACALILFLTVHLT
ncbi:MAG TPA: oligosaccharide flippase family protein, partial [Kiritimatiellia bacterium]|nr:oligosaccharide flippase family protein [Kiritimatiellia bacterium]